MKSLYQWILNASFILIGLVMLVLGSHWLIAGSIAVARAIGVSELVVGLTIAAAGTFLPEVATSIIAAIRGERDIAVGSNIFNILAVLGLSSMISPPGITVSNAALWFDIPVMIAVSIACLPIFFTGHIIARWEGIMFLGYYAAYTVYLLLESTSISCCPCLIQ